MSNWKNKILTDEINLNMEKQNLDKRENLDLGIK